MNRLYCLKSEICLVSVGGSYVECSGPVITTEALSRVKLNLYRIGYLFSGILIHLLALFIVSRVF